MLDYVTNFKERLLKTWEFARNNLKQAQKRMKTWYDRKTKSRVFKPGDKVLVFLPITGQPLSARYSGPYTIARKVNDVDYIVNTPDRRKITRLCHVNMLKEYYDRDNSQTINPVAHVVVFDGNEKSKIVIDELVDNVLTDCVDFYPTVQKAFVKNSEVLNDLGTNFDYLSSDEALSDLVIEYNDRSESELLEFTDITSS